MQKGKQNMDGKYTFKQFEKNIAIILKENKSIEEVKVKYLNKLFKIIEYY